MLMPGKGVRMPLTMEFIEWQLGCMQEIQDVLEAFTIDPSVDDLIAAFESREWEYEKDKYGYCFWADYNYSDTNIFRVKVVVDLKLQARIDFRDWWEKG